MSQESVENIRLESKDLQNARLESKDLQNIRLESQTAQVPHNDDNAVKSVRIHTDFISLQDLLKLVGAVHTGGEAKIRIQNGETLVNGLICLQRGKKLRPGDTVSFHGKSYAVQQYQQ